MQSVPITIPGAPHNFTLTYIYSQLSSFAYSNYTLAVIRESIKYTFHNKQKVNTCIIVMKMLILFQQHSIYI